MTETQAMSDAAGTPANPADKGSEAADADRAATGRAAVPASLPDDQSGDAKQTSISDGSSKSDKTDPKLAGAKERTETESATTTNFTRAPGMPTPPGTSKPTMPGQQADKKAPPGRTAMGATTLRSVVNSATAGAVRVTEAVRAARTGVSAGASRGPRRARLSVKRVDPWSVMKFSFAVSFVLLVVIIVATSVLYLALDAMGVFSSVNQVLAELQVSQGATGDAFQITASLVIGFSAILGAINVLLFTALMTLGAFVYNVCADLVGGVEVTLAERE